MENPHRDRAVHLLQHYFRLVAQAAGNKWAGDHDAELAVCVDEIIDAAVLVVREERKIVEAVHSVTQPAKVAAKRRTKR